MTATAIVLLVATALSSLVPVIVRRRLRSTLVVDAVTTAVMVGFAATAAALAADAAPARGVGVVVVACAAMIAAVGGGGYVVRLVLWAGGADTRERARDSATGDGEHVPDAESESGTEAEAGPLRGGRVIGYLERAAVAATLLAGWPEGLAVILAVKSLARYPELRAPHAGEQFIMGTFASVLWATAMAGVGFLITH
ncbi:hypothetical protein [Gordonia insulae]|uniref:Uncharacterized protein n=1 Tax=Gordonia insulae TaxID=2420509 RepID=A0A3G8JGT5_9ACTN|nr:hypothetical protein [Gordonia insulae]AZG44361.1 hypothetical protein D7316_00945 [Gordonia insulae]